MSLLSRLRIRRPASEPDVSPYHEAFDREIPAAAELLDVVRPRWYREVNVHALNLVDVHRCVLGQLWGRYGDGEHALERYLLRNDRSTDVLDAFHSNASNELWRAEIERRRVDDLLSLDAS